VDLSTCLNSVGAEDHHDKVADCQEITDSKTELSCDATHDQIVEAASTSHVHEMCIMEKFGWVNSEGDLQTQDMLNDLNNNVLNEDASQKLMTAMQGEQADFKDCVTEMVENEMKAAKAKHDQYVENCPENAEKFTEDEVKEQQAAHGSRGLQTAEAHCLMLEVGKACGAEPQQA